MILVAEAALKNSQPWAIPALVGYATIVSWYLLEPLYFPNAFTPFDSDILDATSLQVFEFLIWLRIFIWLFSRIAVDRIGAYSENIAVIPASRLLYWNALVWLVLLSIGVYRMDGDWFGALFPLASRSGSSMWSRAAAGNAGDTGFLVSMAAYLYTLVCALFGILFPFINRRSTKLLALVFLLASWPYFLLQGSRNAFLAVFLPSFASYMLFSGQRILVKCILAVILYLGVDYAFHMVISYRNVGFDKFLGEEINPLSTTKHVGLGMMSELAFINTFYDSGILDLSYGLRYLQEFVNFIPRAIWPEKPLIGIDYAILRGFGARTSDIDIGVFATISTGLIGQGFLNFGPFFGPAASAIMFSSWIAILARFRNQQSVPRLALFLLGLGLTFNLGRDFTLLVLWPFVFGYAIVRVLEMKKKRSELFTRQGRIRAADDGSPAKQSIRWP